MIPSVALQSWDTEVLVFDVLTFGLRSESLAATPTDDLASYPDFGNKRGYNLKVIRAGLSHLRLLTPLFQAF